MKHHFEINGDADPFMMWTDLTLKYFDIIIESSNVINHRAGLALLAKPIQAGGNRDELSLMIQEKIDAATESIQAVTSYIMTWNQQLGVQAVKQLLALTTAMSFPTETQAIGQSLHRQVKLAAAIGETTLMTVKLSDNVIHLAQQGLKPFHSRVTANAKRLAGRSPESKTGA